MAKQDLWLPTYISQGMVLQQQSVVILRGRARPGTQVRVQLERFPFDGRAVSPLDPQYGCILDLNAASDELGWFSIELPPLTGSFDPYILTFTSGREQQVLRDVLVGEVWLSGGQSNMAMPLRAVRGREHPETIANLNYVRIFHQSEDGLKKSHRNFQMDPLDDIAGGAWLAADDAEAMLNVSAIALSFARDLHLDLKLPVAIIESAQGGSFIHTWLSRPVIESNPAIQQHIEQLGFYRDASNWNMIGDWGFNLPAVLYNHHIAPLKGFGIRGILWYQGESDHDYPSYYQDTLKLLIKDWMTLLISPADRPFFLYVQLASYLYDKESWLGLSEFNEMLAAVRRTLPCPAGLVTISDLALNYADAPADWCHPIHPTEKLVIGQRLKTLACGLVYSRKAPQSAPECQSLERVGNKLMLTFSNTGEGLRLIGEANRLRGFAICGPDRIFHEAKARILYGVRVLVWHDQIQEPCAVTYAFADFNQHANLVSQDHLPVVAFRTDREPSKYWPPLEWIHCDGLETWTYPFWFSQFTDLKQEQRPGLFPAWKVLSGTVAIRLEKANKHEGDAALFMRYTAADVHPVQITPEITYASMHPPLDLSAYQALSVDLFNPDMQMKQAALILSDQAGHQASTESQTILSVLRWQSLSFKLNQLPLDLSRLTGIVFEFSDRKGRGDLYMDSITAVI